MRSVLVTGPALNEAAMALAARHNVRVITMTPYAAPDEAAALLAAEQADAVIVRMGRLTDAAIAASSRLKIIVKHGVGVDTIDVDAATKRQIPVLTALGANAQSVAEHALALMFGVSRSIPYLDGRIRQGHWDKATSIGTELFGKTLGIVGLGMIGRILLSLVQPLRMKLLAFDPKISADMKETLDITGLTLVDDLDALLQQSDYVSLHCPLTPSTRGMIGPSQLALMKRDAFLINTARGELVDMAALASALAEGKIAGAGLDTFSIEPPPADSDLWPLHNLVVTPHVGANTHAAAARVGLMAMQHVLDALDGKAIDPRFAVNPSVLNLKAVTTA
ncbi:MULTISPECIES: hydroxyacid dehydrogenase [unclassified Acidocella]|uniref:hydroxyacid dehydrogenase n=1 Tax=unclassified Acidocella TaxID=2648610 RepID=UPI000587B9A3|nr:MULTISPECIES: hydroxyacid dehydrogenase [unclassified Acidocella]WBO58492.1 hydroxyacid dehydrogenase [Acidocella sp. MX-AZ03]